MKVAKIEEIFETFGHGSLGGRTVKQTIFSLAKDVNSAEGTPPPRKIVVYWGFILTACANENVTPHGIQDLIDSYEEMYSDTVLKMFGTVPYLLEAMKMIESEPGQLMIEHLAAISVVAIAKAMGK